MKIKEKNALSFLCMIGLIFLFSSFDRGEKFLNKSPSDPLLIRRQALQHIHQSSSPNITSSPSSWMISFHQQVISLGDGPRSHFYPTSSEYMRRAIIRHGTLGYFLGMDRLLRENGDPWHYPLIQIGFSTRKYDPVP